MFPPTYFAPTYFPPTYFGVGSGDTAVTSYETELEALYALYRATPELVTACADRWYLDEAPEGTVLPYVTVMLVGRTPTPTTGALRTNLSLVQVSIHDRLPSGCEAIARRIRAAFDGTALAIGGPPTGHCFLSAEGLTKAEGKGPGGKDCRMHTLDFEIWYSPDTGS